MHARTSSFEGASNVVFKNVAKKLSVNSANIYLAVSHLAGQWLFGGKPYSVIPNAVNVKKYSFSNDDRDRIRAQYGLGDAFVIGHVGRNTYAKNHEYLLSVFNEFTKIQPNSKLLLVGFGQEAENIVRLCTEMNLSDRVVLCGYQENTAPFYSAMDELVFPSRYEGFPGTLIEAQTNGLRCIVSDTVTSEVGVTPDLEFLSLKKPPRYWAEKILEESTYERHDNRDAIEEAGYSLEKAAMCLMNIYEKGIC